MLRAMGLVLVCGACNGGEPGVGPLPPLVALAGAGGCWCAGERRAAAPSYDCEADAMPEGAALCQRGHGTIYCAPAGQRVQTFTGDVACDPGFCLSVDGERCAFDCACRR